MLLTTVWFRLKKKKREKKTGRARRRRGCSVVRPHLFTVKLMGHEKGHDTSWQSFVCSSECEMNTWRCWLVLSGSKPFWTLWLKSQVWKSINAATWPSCVSKLEGSIVFIYHVFVAKNTNNLPRPNSKSWTCNCVADEAHFKTNATF